uniref:Rac/Cdc42 guanine nucleotide exchange factor 6 n=1 Tax=Gadus morhua TaxID=8049 RepID=A0A8C5ACN2_GADMO
MNPEEQTVTWLISLGVLSSPKKNIADPEDFLKTSLKDGVVVCKLIERVVPGFTAKYCQDPRTEADCISNIREFLRGCTSLKVEGFEAECLYTGEQFGKVLTTLLAVNFEMGENGGGGQAMVKARFNFKQNNEDELSFNKGDLIHVSRQEDGGWWEGSLSGRTGWFPSNYVREVKPCEKPGSPKGTPLTKNYYSVVVQDILEHEREFVKELQTVLGCYLRPLQASDKLSSADSASLCGNLEEILTFQQGLCVALEECTKVQESLQRVAGCYLNLLPQIRHLYLAYCSSHPSAVCVLTDHSEELDKFMESQGASGPGILTLTTSLSRPFMRLDKYPTLLQELERHVEVKPQGSPSLLRACTLPCHCQDLRKRKNLELQILSEPVRGWEGDSMKSLGSVAYMSTVHTQSGTSEEKEECYLMLFPNMLVMLSASPRMSGFIYQVGTAGGEDPETAHYVFDITGQSVMERLTVFCSTLQDYQEWLEHLQPYIKGGSPPLSMVGTPSHLSHLGSFSVGSRSPLEPPKLSKPWSLSCLRPAPPLKPSAALGYKEVGKPDSSKSPRPIKKFLPGNRKKDRKPSEDDSLIRKSTAALEEDAQILKVIEAYCTGAGLHQSASVRKECGPQVLLPEEEKIIVEEMKSNGQTVIEEKSLVDAVYALKDEVHELKKEHNRMRQFLEDEQKSRKDLERVVRKLSKQKNDMAWDDANH